MGRCRAVATVGGRFFIPSHGFNPSEISTMLKAGEINAISAVPSQWRVLLATKDLIGDYGKRVRWIEIGSQYMSRQEKEELKALFPEARIVQHYGLTEASRTTLLEIHRTEGDALESVGQALAGVEVKITEEGLIAVRGQHVAQTYLINGHMVRLQDENGWFLTKDLGHLENGFLYYKGRADDVINCGGIKIHPEVLEAKIYASIGGFRDSLAICRKVDPLLGESFSLTVTKEVDLEHQQLQEAALSAAAELGFKGLNTIPVLVIDKLPKTSTGKVQRKQLAEIYALQTTPAEPPLSGKLVSHKTHGNDLTKLTKQDLKVIVAQVFAEILGIDKVEAHDNFFTLGGNSLLAVQALTKIGEKLQKTIPLSALFQAPTIEQLANALSGPERLSTWHSLVPIQPNGSRPPLFGIHILYFHDLIRHLGPDQPIYGLRYGLAAKTLGDKPPLPSRIEDLATHYIAVFSQLRQGILTNFGTPISSNFGRGIASTSAGVNS
jgi:acyl carrier protein